MKSGVAKWRGWERRGLVYAMDSLAGGLGLLLRCCWVWLIKVGRNLRRWLIHATADSGIPWRTQHRPCE